MRKLFRSISRWLLLVMLATVLSPSFGWEAGLPMPTQGDQPVHHADHAMMADASGHEGHEGHEMAMAQDAAAADCDGCTSHHDMANCAETQHHCCPGSVLGHLPGTLSAGMAFALPFSGNLAVDRQNARFSTRTPEGLERPPRAATA